MSTETCPTCWQKVNVPQRGDHDYGMNLAAATPSPEPGLDVERLVSAMFEAYSVDKNGEPDLPFYDDHDAFWRPFAARVVAEYNAATPLPAPGAEYQSPNQSRDWREGTNDAGN